VLDRLHALLQLPAMKPPESDIPKRWLLSTSSRIESRFKKREHVVITHDAEFQYVTVRGMTFPWPRDAATERLISLLSELLEPSHPHQYEFGQTLVRSGDTVLDIGACEGGFAAIATQKGANVLAVEPSALNSILIRRLFALWHLQEPRIAQCLLGETSTVAHFLDDPLNPAKSRISDHELRGTYPVPVLTLDELVEREKLRQVDFIKCDAEGQDVAIIKSGKHTIRRFRPRIAVTTYHNDSDYVDLHEFLSQEGYHIAGKGFLWNGRKLRVVMLHAW
jgi:FkbM family methyltransferase